MKRRILRGQDRRRAIEARTMAVWENGGPDNRYRPRAYNAVGNWQVFDHDDEKALSDDELLAISPATLASEKAKTVH